MAIEVPFLPEHLRPVVENAINDLGDGLGMMLADVPGGEDDDYAEQVPDFAVLGGLPHFIFDPNDLAFETLRHIGWSTLIGFVNGKHLIVDLDEADEVSSVGQTVLAHALPTMIARATITWGYADSSGPMHLITIPWLSAWAVRVPGCGVILEEGWVMGDHGLPMSEDDFLNYVSDRSRRR